MDLIRNCSQVQIVGLLDAQISSLLNITGTSKEIYLGPTNAQHMIDKHFKTYDKYFENIPDIISNPDYIGKHPSDGSIEYIKEYDERVLLAVRIGQSGRLYARSLYDLSDKKLQSYLKSGRAFRMEKK